MNNVIQSDDEESASDEAHNLPGAFPNRPETSTGAKAAATANYPKLPSMMGGSAVKMPYVSTGHVS